MTQGTAVPAPPPTPPAWTGIGCPDAYVLGATVAPGGSVTVTKDGISLVYTCAAYPASGWCPLVGYEPGTGSAWQQAWTLKGSCAGTLTPTSSPSSSLPNQGGCPVPYTKGSSYTAGDKVSKEGMSFVCNAYPMSLFCGQDGYVPLTTSHGGAYKLAWTTLGPCAGTIAPATSSPTTAAIGALGGCPPAYVAGGSYSGGTQVSKATSSGATKRYECKQGAESGYCNQVGFEPGSTYSFMGWTDLGECTGTFTPPALQICNYLKYTTVLGPDVQACAHGSSTSCTCTPVPTTVNAQGYECTKPVERSVMVITDTLAWSDSTTYLAGDEVRSYNKAYKCKPYPYTAWCSEKAYQPPTGMSTATTGLWTEAWIAVGDCKENTYSPTSVPSKKPSSFPSSDPSTNPSSFPSSDPSTNPSSDPSTNPSSFPSSDPSTNPSSDPSTDPSSFPSSDPSTNPSSDPSTNPSQNPSVTCGGAPARAATILACPAGSKKICPDTSCTNCVLETTPC